MKVWCWGWFLGAFCWVGGSKFVVLLVSFCYFFLVLCVCLFALGGGGVIVQVQEVISNVC